MCPLGNSNPSLNRVKFRSNKKQNERSVFCSYLPNSLTEDLSD
ncbi:hypothetical protein LEP1GSC016_0661 [Leptospira borgpetersenii serovar Hardjo-bovis str. Sponselee]|uniref:Uncharacterized protein n=1 Tax=Leptospira borgpetersenii serovar Hardjo-bovis str. Sponselee TaxID=1303729 RepID=M6BEY3_LEPBO|nr:hypothetical protein LEP1GSC016_0661 [Leptospira borgpetersenii serovar Hardjo-bovis str. Sponselee]